MGYREIALPLAAKGIASTPVRPGTKRAFLPEWEKSATLDPAQIEKWDAEYPGHGGAAVATGLPDGVWFLEVDSPDVIQKIQNDTGKQIPDTFRVRSQPGRGHFYWRNTPASLAMGNIPQLYGDWSARVQNEYVVAAGSIHPTTHLPYEALREEPIIPAPDWLIDWLIAQRAAKKPEPLPVNPTPAELVPHGQIHPWMLSQAGRLRSMGLSPALIEPALLELVHKYCAPPIDDEKVRQMARSIGNYPAGEDKRIILTDAAPVIVQPSVSAPIDISFEDRPYPKFPKYVMKGTSLYENFVKPVCDQNSRIDYFMWLPAMQILLNYVGPKIKIKGALATEHFKGSIYSVIIGRKGRTNKSSSVNDAIEYFNYASVLQHANRDMKNAQGKTIVWTAGSPEGLGLDMQRTNCKNALLFYDELSTLINKAGIDSSALRSALLTMYESGKFDNSVKSTKETFCHEPNSYCTSLIACTTNTKFTELWSRLAGEDTGLNDRFMFILQPELLPNPRLQVHVNTMMGSIETKKLLDKAIQQGEYSFEDRAPLTKLVAIENRYAKRAEKWAVGIAIDMGLTEVDTECIERAISIVEYEIAVKKYLQSYEATTREGQIQQEIRRTLELNRGSMQKTALMRKLNADRHGTSLWNQAYRGLGQNGIIREIGGTSSSDPLVVQLLVKREISDEE